MKKQKGITLIALVITIIVLLILAGVTIAMVAGDNGILTRTDNASENTRGGKVEEAKLLWQNEKKIAEYDEDSNIKVETQEELLTRLVEEGSLTEKEKKEIEETGQVTIGNKTIVFEKITRVPVSYKLVCAYFTNGVKDGDTSRTNQGYVGEKISKQAFKDNNTYNARVYEFRSESNFEGTIFTENGPENIVQSNSEDVILKENASENIVVLKFERNV